MKLSNRVALVTGSSNRVGKVIALALAREGADVVVHYGGSALAAQQTASEIEALGVRVAVEQADLGRWDEAVHLGERALGHFGHVDILVNSASSFVHADYLHTSEAQFDEAMNVNVKGPYALSQVIGQAMVEGAGGHIINIVDEGAFYPSSRSTAHGISKAALLALTHSQVVALGPRVRVNAICPGPIMKPPATSDEHWERLRERSPLNEIGTAEQLAEVVLFLLTGPSFIDGDCIMLEGGHMWKREF